VPIPGRSTDGATPSRLILGAVLSRCEVPLGGGLAGDPDGAPAGGAGGSGSSAPLTARSFTPTHSSCPIAFVVITRTCTSGCPAAAAGSAALTGVRSPATLGPAVASATNPAGTFAKSPEAPTRYCSATGCTASAIGDASTSRSTYDTVTVDHPRVSSDSTRCGASAVAEPWIATVGSDSSNSVTPAARPTAPGSVRLAFTSTGVPAPSASTVRGSTPATAVRPSPR
jgi:hypothetical protein